MSGLARRALLIGVGRFDAPGFPDLPSSRADVEQLADVLEDRAIGAFEVTRRFDLTAARMREEIEVFSRARTAGEPALVYISSHGARDVDRGFVFVGTDTDPERLFDTGLPAAALDAALEDCAADQRVAVLDCCDSGAFGIGFRSTPVAKGSAAPPAGFDRPPSQPTGVYVLASSDAAQSSYAGNDTPDGPAPSVFTGAVVDVLRSGAAATPSSDEVAVDDVFEAVATRLRGRTPRPDPGALDDPCQRIDRHRPPSPGRLPHDIVPRRRDPRGGTTRPRGSGGPADERRPARVLRRHHPCRTPTPARRRWARPPRSPRRRTAAVRRGPTATSSGPAGRSSVSSRPPGPRGARRC